MLATKGHPKRQSNKVHQFIISPVEQHSKKPDITREKILALMGDYRVLNCLQGSIPLVGTYGEMKSKATYGLPERRFEMAYVTVPKDLTKSRAR